MIMITKGFCIEIHVDVFGVFSPFYPQFLLYHFKLELCLCFAIAGQDNFQVYDPDSSLALLAKKLEITNTTARHRPTYRQK